MNLVPLDEKWFGLIDETWLTQLDAAPFLGRCRRRTVSIWELRAFVAQQYHYSRHFTRYLCALMVGLDREQDRAELAGNLFEEMGLSGGNGLPHAEIYRRMLAAMEVDPEAIPVLPSTAALVEAMLSACTDPDPMVGLGALCLGAEAIVPHIYSQVLRGFRSVGEAEENLEFFRIHIDGDDEHAVTMRRIIDREAQDNPRRILTLKASAQRLIAARTAFFQGLSRVPLPRGADVAVAAEGRQP
jgi:pyrroloquinoline quinone (PQQ) biosynthesis protein C